MPNDTKKPKVSFVCPAFNDGDEVEHFVDSILDQDFTDFELIIINDGSTDSSKDIIDAIAQKDERIRAFHFDKNQGACVARNYGAKQAKGEYYIFLPADSFLYPGVLTTWIDQLEEYKEYDFVYGGYRVVDKEYNRLPNMEFLFQPFDPYLLETTNYIDGSFPIRAKAFWEVAELMNKSGKQKSDGLWDPAVKSLQDWDYWLSVVKEGKRKGIYIQDIFFETTAPHEGGLSFDSSAHWLERMDQIKKKHDIPIRKVCVQSLGAGFHAKRLAYILSADFQEMPSRRPHHYETIYVIGFYPEFARLQDSAFLNDYYNDSKGRTPAKKVVHFVGTDIWQLRQISLNGLDIWKSYMRNAVDEVLVEADFTQAELKEILGITAKIVPIPPAKLYDVMPLPKKFTVACYQPQTNSNFYNPQLMEEIAKEMPDVRFKFYGHPMQQGKHATLENVEYVGYVNDMESFIKDCSAIIRFPFHDGLSISLLEFILAGRYASTNVPVRHAFFVPKSDKASIIESIKQIRDMAGKGVNQNGSDYWREELKHDKYRQKMAEICGYDPQEYWDKRAESWHQQAQAMGVEEADVRKFFDEVAPENVLDLGCGDGRWVRIFDKWGFDMRGYFGTDIAGKLIEICQKRFPSLASQFLMQRVEELDLDRRFDLIFSYTTLEHVKEEDMPNVVERLKKHGKQLLLIEPTDFDSRYYCRAHSYEKLFKVVKKKKLKDKVIMLCDLS